MSRYILPEVLMEKSEELNEITNALTEIIREAGDIAIRMRQISEFDTLTRILEKEEEYIMLEAQSVIRLSEALYEIADLTQRTENTIAEEIEEGRARVVSYRKTETLNQFDPEDIDIY